MSKKVKEICKWDKGSYEKQRDVLEPIVLDPRFFCRTCGRVSKFKKYLCKPVKLNTSAD